MRRQRLLIFALGLTLALPQGALAAVSQETLTVFSVSRGIIVSLPTIAYGSVTAGSQASASFTIEYWSNTAGSVTLETTNLTSGPNTIAASNREFVFGAPFSSPVSGFVALTPKIVHTLPAGGTNNVHITVDVTSKVNVPGGTPDGAYTGTLTWLIN
jgi:hypothetical protein